MFDARAGEIGARSTALRPRMAVRGRITTACAIRARAGGSICPRPSLLGAHQIVNAGTAIACLEQLPGLPIAAATIAHGLRHIEWPARLQRLTPRPAGRGIAERLGAVARRRSQSRRRRGVGGGGLGLADRPLYLVVGMLNTKDAAGFLAPLAPHAAPSAAVAIPGEQNPLPSGAIAAAARAVGLPARKPPSVAAAVAAITAADPDARPYPDLRLASSRRHRPCREWMTAADLDRVAAASLPARRLSG